MKFIRIMLFVLVGSFLLSSCEKEFSTESGLAAGVLKDDGSGDCLPVTVNGTYTVGTLLTTANSVDIQVTFNLEGVYGIQSDTVNGYSFHGTGTVSTTGISTIHLTASGTPTAIGSGVDVFHLTYGTSACTFNIVLNGAGGGGGGGTTGTITANVGTTATTFNSGASASYTVPATGASELEIFGTNATTGELVDIIIAVPSTTIAAGTYNVNAAGTTYALLPEYDDAAGTAYTASTGSPANPTPVFTLTLGNSVSGPTGTVSGTFSGAVDDGSGGIITLNSGTFTLPVN